MKRELRCNTGTVPAAVNIILAVVNLSHYRLKRFGKAATGCKSEDLPKAFDVNCPGKDKMQMKSRLILLISCCLASGIVYSQLPADTLVTSYIASPVNVVAAGKETPFDQKLELGQSLNFKSADLGTVLDRSGVAGILSRALLCGSVFRVLRVEPVAQG